VEDLGAEEANIRMDLRAIGWEDLDWIHLACNSAQVRALVNMVMKLGFHKSCGFLE
jgi:hypothetical protein